MRPTLETSLCARFRGSNFSLGAATTRNPGNKAKARFRDSGHRLAAPTMPPTLKMSTNARFQGWRHSSCLRHYHHLEIERPRSISGSGGLLFASTTTTTPEIEHPLLDFGGSSHFLAPTNPKWWASSSRHYHPPQNRAFVLDFWGGGLLLAPTTPPLLQSSTDARFWEWWSSLAPATTTTPKSSVLA